MGILTRMDSAGNSKYFKESPLSLNLILTSIFLLSSLLLPAQVLICDGAKGPNLFTNYNNGTFGQGVPQNKGALGGATTYTYIPISCNTPSDGFYSVANSTDCTGSGGKVFGTWDIIGDHTGAADPIEGNPPPAPGTNSGYMMVVNASVGKDIAVTDSIRNLCPDQVYEFQAWIRSLNPPGILPNLMFMINGVDTYPTGNITDKKWKNIGFTFTVPAGQKAIKVAIRNNAPGGDGNDWVLDDVSVNTCNVKIKINADSVIKVCEGATITLKDTVQSTTNTAFPYYKWQRSTNNGLTWTDLTGVLQETTNPKNYVSALPPFIATLTMNNYLYRFIVATDADILTKNNECDYAAVKITRLVVTPYPVIKVAPVTICAGDTAILIANGADIYTWSPKATLNTDTGKTVKATPIVTTTYTIIGKTFAGCPDTTEVTVTVKPIVADAGPNAHICSGASTVLNASGGTNYSWQPTTGLSDPLISNPTANPLTTITYTVTVTSGNCIDTDTVTVTIVPPIQLNIAGFPPKCFNGSDGQAVVIPSGGGGVYTYQWAPVSGTSANIYAIPGTYTVVVTDQFGCKETASTTIPNTPAILGKTSVVAAHCSKADGSATVDTVWGGSPAYTYTWNTTPVQTTPTASMITAGTYSVTITDINGCTTVLEAIVPNTPGITTSTTTTDVKCFGGNDGTATAIGAGGDPPYTYVWSNAQNASTVSGLTAGTYTVVVTDSKGCATVGVVTINQPAQVMLRAFDKSICPLSSAVIHATATGGTGLITYAWEPGGLTGDSVSVSPISTTTYTVTGTDANGCSGKTTVTVTVNSIPVIYVADDTICFGTSTMLTAADIYKYVWSPPTGLNTTTNNTVIANPSSTTTYTVVGTDTNGCTGSTTVTVSVIPAPVITATGGNACPGDTIVLNADGGIKYTWSPLRFLNVTTGPSVKSIPDVTTSYTVTGTGANGCMSTAIAVATVNPEPVAGIIANPNPASVFKPIVFFTDNSVGDVVKWKWSFGDSKKSTSVQKNPSFTYPDSIESYNVQLIVVNQFGCIDTTQLMVTIKGEYSFFIPNTFTPNDDRINDGFAPKGTGIDASDYGFWIFDRWGNLIWQTNTWGQQWDGRANDGENIAQIDTYVWKVRVKEFDTQIIHNYIGHVNIVK
jgi:gliding motility-associated-like protein